MIPVCTHKYHPGPISAAKFRKKHNCTHKVKKGKNKGQIEQCPWLEFY
jgi:hypothetical protein